MIIKNILPEIKSIFTMATINRVIVFFMEKNIRGAWVVYGIDGVKQYYGYTKAQARQMYIDECKVFVNQK